MNSTFTQTNALFDGDVIQRHSIVDVAVQRLIRDTDGAQLLGCSKATWWRRVGDGTLPPAIKIGGMSRWKLSDVLAVIEQLRECPIFCV